MKILIVDGQRLWVDRASSVLLEAGHRVESLVGRHLAELPEFAALDWDVVVMASVGAVSDGHLMDSVRTWVGAGGRRPVVLSCLPTPLEARDAMRAGADDYDKKSWDLEQILSLASPRSTAQRRPVVRGA